MNVKPEGGGGGDPSHMWRSWPLLPSQPLGIWLRVWVPALGHLLFTCGGMGQRQCSSVRWPSWNWSSVAKALKGGFFSIEVSICFYIYTRALFLSTHFQYKLMEHLTLWGSLININSSKNQALEGGEYLIWFYQILGPPGGDFDQKFFWEVKCPTYAQGTPDALHSSTALLDFFIIHLLLVQSCNIVN